MRRALVVSAAVALLLGAAGCGGGSSPAPATPVDTRALISLAQTSVGLLGLSSNPDQLLRLELPVQIENRSDVPGNVNYVRLQLFVDDVEIERAEVTADDIVALAGTNRVTRQGALTLTLLFEFNSQDFTRADLRLSGRDDAANDFDHQLQGVQVELAPELVESRR